MSKNPSRRLVQFNYTNHRQVLSPRIVFRASAWYPSQGKQWLLVGEDMDRGETREFLLSRINAWREAMVSKEQAQHWEEKGWLAWGAKDVGVGGAGAVPKK